MDTEIQTSTPPGSPLLAYGESRRSRIPGRLIIFCVASVVVFGLLAALIGAFVFTVELPKNTVLLAAFHGQSQLPDPLPRIWQHTAETSKLPFIAGIAQTDTGWTPFTITLRGFANAGGWTHGASLFALHADTPIETKSTHRAYEIGPPIIQLWKHEVYVILSTSASPLSQNSADLIRGSIDQNIWKTSARITSHATDELVAGDLSIDLTAFPESWPLSRDALKDTGIDIDQMPETLSWTAASGTLPTLVMTYGPASPSTSTILGLAAATGQFDTAQVQLPDKTMAEDLRLPRSLLSSTTSAPWEIRPTAATSTPHMLIEPHLASIVFGTATQPLLSLCSGRIIGFLNSSAIQTIAQRLGILFESDRSIELMEDEGHLSICW